MSKLTWDSLGEKLYETGVKKGVLFPFVAGAYAKGVAWNGLTGVTESPSGAEPTALYANDAKYGEIMSTEQFGGTIEAYMYPDEFAQCDGSADIAPGVSLHQQTRKPFGFSYVTTIGNDTDGIDYGYKLHIVYGAMAKPSQKTRSTINESAEAGTMSWEFSTTPVPVEGFKPTSHIEIDSTKVDPAELKALEDMLYGSTNKESTLPMPDEFKTLFAAARING